MSIKETGKAQSQPGAEALAALGKIIEAWEAWQETMHQNGGGFGEHEKAQAFGLALTEGRELLERGKK